MSAPDLRHVLETPYFLVTPCNDCDVPGYLILQPRQQSDAFSGLVPEALSELGLVLARLETAVQAVTLAEHVYFVRFSESLSSVHFHIFPRTRGIAEQWCSAELQASTGGINAPLLFAWARIKWHVSSPSEISALTLRTAGRIAAALE